MSPVSADTREKVLIVDDEPVNLQVLRHVLQDSYCLLFARSGAKAIELAIRERPQLILLDVMMPGMTGHEVCRELKRKDEPRLRIADPEDQVGSPAP